MIPRSSLPLSSGTLWGTPAPNTSPEGHVIQHSMLRVPSFRSRSCGDPDFFVRNRGCLHPSHLFRWECNSNNNIYTFVYTYR